MGSIWHSFAGVLTRRSIVRSRARWLRIERVEDLTARADVWDITVPGVEHFALANGAIVHNSADAYRTGAVMMPRETYTVKEPPRWQTEPTFNDALEAHDAIVAEQGGRERFEPL